MEDPARGGSLYGMALARDASSDYRRLLAALGSRARWLGSRDPESAAQETLTRSLGNPSSQAAIEYYFTEELEPGTPTPDWQLDQLLAWLHGVLYFVVREEHNRASTRREILLSGREPAAAEWSAPLDPADPRPDQLHDLIKKEMQKIVLECLPLIDPEYQAVLKFRAQGLKYDEIAARMGTNENTIATWVSRGIKTLGQCVRRRTQLSIRTQPSPGAEAP